MNHSAQYKTDIKQLLQSLDAEALNSLNLESTECTGLTEDSRNVKIGDCYIARPGYESDGRRFIHQATARGAITVITEASEIEHFAQAMQCPVAIYKVKNLSEKMGMLSDLFYQHPSADLTIVGVTGTNGKTSCSQLIAKVADHMDKDAAVMGTLGNGRLNKLNATGNTTTDAITLHSQLAEFRDSGVDLVSMEVSSHALEQGRVNAVDFNIALFTNLSRDHLDYHGDMRSYAAAKKVLLTKQQLDAVIINADDAKGCEFLEDDDISAEKFSFSITSINSRAANNSVWTEAVEFHDAGIKADITTPWGSIDFSTSMIGQFNLSNCLAVISTFGVLGFDVQKVAEILSSVSYVEGRMERFGGDDKPLVIVDYAHTPDALKHVLKALQPHTSHKLWSIFGCGGDRDKGKRSEMAAIAEEFADHLIFTSDNPRSESMEDIVTDMMQGLIRPSSCEVEYDRETAIRTSISRAVLGDVVLVAGKGHEQFQQIGNEKIPLCDIDIVQQALAMGSWR